MSAQHAKRSIIGHHLTLTLYGHWVPNDPRGSGSTTIESLPLAQLGEIHHGRKPPPQQPSRNELRSFYSEANGRLIFPVFWLDDTKRRSVADAIAKTIRQQRYTCYAFAVLRNHAHILIRIHRDSDTVIWDRLAGTVRVALRHFGDIAANHPILAERPYSVFKYTPLEMRRAIDYIDGNPAKEGLPRQNWDFVTEYDDWPHHKRAVSAGLER